MSGASTSLTSAVGGIAPLMIGGGVAGRARDPQVPDRAPLGGFQSPRAPVPGVSQAGPLTGLQHCPPLPHYSMGLLSHSAVPARLEEHQFVAQLATGNRKGTKRAATGPSPASPPVGKKKKKGGKKASKPKKTKAANPHKKGRSGAVSDSDLFAMMQLVVGRHGWSVGDPPAPTSQGLAQAALHPATSAPPPVPPAGQAASYHTTMAPPPGQAASYHTTMAPPLADGPGSLIPHDYGSAAGSAGGPGSLIPHDYGSAAGFSGGPAAVSFPPTPGPSSTGSTARGRVFPATGTHRARGGFYPVGGLHFHGDIPIRLVHSTGTDHRRHGRVVGDLGGTVPGGAGGYPRPETPQRGCRSPAPPLSERFLRSPAGRCRVAAPRLTALQIGG